MVEIRQNLRSLLLGGLLFLFIALVISIFIWIMLFVTGWYNLDAHIQDQTPLSDDASTSGSITTSESVLTLSPIPQPGTTSTSPPTPIASPSSTATITPTPTATPDPWVEDTLGNMTLEEKIGQMLMMGVDGKEISPATCGLIQNLSPGGVIYRAGNTDSPAQLRTLSSGLQECSAQGVGIPLLISIDHEGQYVTRFNKGVTIFPAALAQGATGDQDFAYQVALAAGQELAYSGVNMVLGPVADVLTDYDNTVISQRSFGGDPASVSQFVAEAVRGYSQVGVIPVLKHFPGHGGVPGDTHYNVVQDQVDTQTFANTYLPPFQSGLAAGVPVVMFGHVAYPSIDASASPASLSPALGLLLRDELGFDGVSLTDSMGMGAISGSTRSKGEAAVLAVLAGEDLLLVTSPATAQATFTGVLEAVQSGTIPEERIEQSVRRILQLKADWGLKTFPLPDHSAPDWVANQELRRQVGYNAVATLKDEAGQMPLPDSSKNILIIGPTDGWGLYPTLGAALEQKGCAYQLYTYSTPWKGPIPETAYLDSLPALAPQYDLTLVLTWEAHINRLRYGDTWQVELVNSLVAKGVPLVVVALKSPTDILEFPQVSTYLATYGTTPGQTQALADTLIGLWEPAGINPLPDLMD